MDSIEALWSVTFASNVQLLPGQSSTGGGIVVFETGRVLGGDPWATYTGKFRFRPGSSMLDAEVEVKMYREGGLSVFGPLSHFNLKLAGNYSRDRFVVEGSLVEHPEQRIAVEFVRRAELP